MFNWKPFLNWLVSALQRPMMVKLYHEKHTQMIIFKKSFDGRFKGKGRMRESTFLGLFVQFFWRKKEKKRVNQPRDRMKSGEEFAALSWSTWTCWCDRNFLFIAAKLVINHLTVLTGSGWWREGGESSKTTKLSFPWRFFGSIDCKRWQRIPCVCVCVLTLAGQNASQVMQRPDCYLKAKSKNEIWKNFSSPNLDIKIQWCRVFPVWPKTLMEKRGREEERREKSGREKEGRLCSFLVRKSRFRIDRRFLFFNDIGDKIPIPTLTPTYHQLS